MKHIPIPENFTYKRNRCNKSIAGETQKKWNISASIKSTITLYWRLQSVQAKSQVKWTDVYLVAERIECDRDREGGERERGEMDLDGDRLRADLLRDRLHKH